MALSTRSKSKKQSNGDDYSPQSSGEVANNVNAANSTIQNTQQATPAHDTTQPPPSKKRKTTMARTRDDKKVKKDTLKTATDAKVAKPKITLKLHVAPKVDEKPVPQEAPLNTSAPPNLEGEGGIFSNVNAKIAPKLQIPPRSEPDQSRRSRWQDKQIMKVLQEQVLQDMESSEAAHAKEGPVYGTYADDTDSIGTLSPGGYNLPDEPSPVRDREADLAENMGALPREFQALTNPFTDHPAPQMRFATRTYGPHITNPYANRQLNFGIHPVDQPGAEQDLFTIGNGREVLSSQDFGAANNATGGDHLTRSVSQPRMAKGRGTSQIQGIDQVDGPVSNNQYVMSPQSSFGKTTYFLMKRPVDGLGSRSISMPTFDPPVTPSNKGPVTTSDGIRPYRYPSYHKAIRGDKIDPQLLLEDDIRFGRAPKPISKIWYTPSHFRVSHLLSSYQVYFILTFVSSVCPRNLHLENWITMMTRVRPISWVAINPA